MTISSLRTYLESYKSRLGLSTWEIKLRWISKKDLKDPQLQGIEDCDGMSWWSAEHQFATIVLSRSAEDLIHTLLHEILHILLEGTQEKPRAYDPLYELSINRIADCILSSEAGVAIIGTEGI